MIRLKHTEIGGYLSADITYESNSDESEAFLRIYDGQYKKEIFSTTSIWEIEQEKNIKFDEYC